MNTYRSLLILLASAVLLGACSPFPWIETPAPSMANPASVFCEANGGRLTIEPGEEGGEVGVCVFEDSLCEEWAFFRGECSPGDRPLPWVAELRFSSLDEAIGEARLHLAGKLEMDAKDVLVVSREESRWSSTCLGLMSPVLEGCGASETEGGADRAGGKRDDLLLPGQQGWAVCEG
jgi:putative hemolysin